MLPPTDLQTIFDRSLVRRHRDRAAPSITDHDFLFRHAGEALLDRLLDVTRTFESVLDLGCHGGTLARLWGPDRRPDHLIQCDLSPAMAATAARTGCPAVAADEEFLPFADASFDLVVSGLSLHWVNDLPGALIQIRRALKPDGLFLGAMLGGETLAELRQALAAAELDVAGGVSPRLSPFTDVRDAGALLQRAGFALPVVDSDTVTATYDHPFRLLRDLRGMGETQAGRLRNPAPPKRAFWPSVAGHYQDRFAEADGRVPARFQIIYLTGWAPHGSQQRPLRPGSARTRLAEALGTVEKPAGDTAGPPGRPAPKTGNR
ncbi:MAG: methyltransferase domain-containing protein [Inquilinaceae bacterium]